jgi:hypothetical protein
MSLANQPAPRAIVPCRRPIPPAHGAPFRAPVHRNMPSTAACRAARFYCRNRGPQVRREVSFCAYFKNNIRSVRVPVQFASNCVGEEAKSAAANLKAGEVYC